jgi:hypothetical protein
MENKNANQFTKLERKIAEFVCLPALLLDWIQMFFTAFSVTKRPVASFRFANYMSTDLMEYMQERGWYK